MKKICIIYGGNSTEHEISIRSATSIVNHLDKDKFEPICIGISKQGGWYYTDNQIYKTIKPDKNKEIHFCFTENKTQWYIENQDEKKEKIHRKIIEIDIVFPVLHGKYGEDGKIQGLFHLTNTPFIGVDLLSAAIAMDKLLTKKILSLANIPIVPFLSFSKGQDYNKEILNNLDKIDFPCIVKPVNLGSSIGITKVHKKEELKQAVDKSLTFDNELLIESFIKGKELEIAVLEVDKKPIASCPGEIKLSKKYDFYDYQSKYEDDNAIEIELPANINQDLEKKMKQYALDTYYAIKARHFIRIDMFIDENNNVYVNEVNAIPGFTSVSMFPELCEQIGFKFQELITHIIKEASTSKH